MDQGTCSQLEWQTKDPIVFQLRGPLSCHKYLRHELPMIHRQDQKLQQSLSTRNEQPFSKIYIRTVEKRPNMRIVQREKNNTSNKLQSECDIVISLP